MRQSAGVAHAAAGIGLPCERKRRGSGATYLPGEQVQVEQIMARFGVSRTPVREALQQLEISGLVAVQPKRGTFVAQVGLPVLIQMFEVMAELGIDLLAAGARPKRLEEASVEASDVVITMGCGDECPFYPGTRYLDWQLDDPAGQGVDAVRPIRDEIDRRVRDLLAELIPSTT